MIYFTKAEVKYLKFIMEYAKHSDWHNAYDIKNKTPKNQLKLEDNTMKKLTILLSIASLVFLITGTAGAIPITATLTADNHYALYFGNEQGITSVGANESDWDGNPGTYNWSEAETFDVFDVALGDYIYVAAWSDGLVAQGLIGQFDFGCGSILTNTSDWEVSLTYYDLDDGVFRSTVNNIQTQINSVTSWSPITNSLDHGAYPWGSISGISEDAQWIWGSELIGASSNGEYQIFRTQIGDIPAPVPEPATLFLLGSGLIGLAGFGRKKLSKKS